MPASTFDIIQTVALILGPGGAVYVGLRGALNGIDKNVKANLKCTEKVEADVDAMQTDVTEIKVIVGLK